MLLACFVAWAGVCSARPLADKEPVRGWTILSDSVPDASITIAAAPAYQINHVQLSHQIVMDLREIKTDRKRDLVNELTLKAHQAGISEVVAWDHAFYKLDYYPKQFRTGPGGTIDLDNAEFWKWFKEDYRAMLDRVPAVDGLVLTFIETGARAERQHSVRLKSNAEKLACVVNAVADVVVGERKLNLYVRTFSYTQKEYANVLGAIALLKRPEIRLMMKETPHDFFLTHPNDPYAGTIERPTIMEFDIAGEFNGQGIIATTWPEYVLRRWRAFATRPHVIGYTARTDRYGNTRLVGRPAEVNLLALRRGAENPQVTAEQVYDEFISTRYGAAALPEVKAAFKNAYDIVTSSLYTLGTSMASHSRLDYDQSSSSYVRHVSGKWMAPPIGYVAHGVNREFHYWRDTINHLAPPRMKDVRNGQWSEVPEVASSGWIQPGEGMTEEYLRYIVTEKKYGVGLAEDSARHIENAQPKLHSEDYEALRDYFQRTLLTARLYRATASAYFGYRTWCRGKEQQTEFVRQTTQDGLTEIEVVAPLIREYAGKPPVGQWDWRRDAGIAERYHDSILKDGWPGMKNSGATLQSGEDPNQPLPKVRIATDGRTFETDTGKPFVPVGVSYFRPGTGWAPQVWKQFDAEATRKDFARMKGMGMNCVRVFLSCGSFYSEPGVLKEEGLKKFDQFLELAEQAGIYVHPTGPDHWEGPPSWGSTAIADQRNLQYLVQFWEQFATRYRGRHVILAYDLKNEPMVEWQNEVMPPQWNDWLRKKYASGDKVAAAWGATNQLELGKISIPQPRNALRDRELLDFQEFREGLADEWTRRQVAAIKAADPGALTTVGMLQSSIPCQVWGSIKNYTGFRPERQARLLDFLEIHFYPLAHGAYEYKSEAEELANLAYLECLVREVARPGKPVVLAEFGWYGGTEKPTFDKGVHPIATEEQQARYLRRSVETSAGFVTGWLNWGLYDHPGAKDVTELIGLLRVDGGTKEWGTAFQRLAARYSGTHIPSKTVGARPALDWDACITDAVAADRFREDYIKAFASDPRPQER